MASPSPCLKHPPLLPSALRRKNKHPHDHSSLSFSILLPLPPLLGSTHSSLFQFLTEHCNPSHSDLTPAGLLLITPALAWLTVRTLSCVASSVKTFLNKSSIPFSCFHSTVALLHEHLSLLGQKINLCGYLIHIHFPSRYKPHSACG